MLCRAAKHRLARQANRSIAECKEADGRCAAAPVPQQLAKVAFQKLEDNERRAASFTNAYFL
jgi:hypothetical protein